MRKLQEIPFRETGVPSVVNHLKIEQCVESLCQSGCAAVRATITAIEAGAEISQISGMSDEEKLYVLEELKAIMSVYDRPCAL